MENVLYALILLYGMQAVLGFVTVCPAASAALQQRRRPPFPTTTTTKEATTMTSTVLAASTEGEGVSNTHTRQYVNRKDALRRFVRVTLGLTTGAAWTGVAVGGAGAALPSAPAPTSTSTAAGGMAIHKSLQELQFEMLKRGLDLTHAFQYEEAEDVYTELIGLFDSDYAALNDRDKQLVAK
jgi:heme A synthase